MLLEEGLDAVFARHARFGAATREAVRAWGLETQCRLPEEHSNTLTGVRLPAAVRCRPVPRARPRALRHVPWPRAHQAQGPDVSHRPSRRFQRSLVDGRTLGCGDGAEGVRRASGRVGGARSTRCSRDPLGASRSDRRRWPTTDPRIAGICRKTYADVAIVVEIGTRLDRHGCWGQDAMSVRSAPTRYGTVAKKQRPKALHRRTFWHVRLTQARQSARPPGFRGGRWLGSQRRQPGHGSRPQGGPLQRGRTQSGLHQSLCRHARRHLREERPEDDRHRRRRRYPDLRGRARRLGRLRDRRRHHGADVARGRRARAWWSAPWSSARTISACRRTSSRSPIRPSSRA